MSNLYIDSEFLEGPQTKKFLGIPYGKTKPTIDLISIAIVADDGREYYAISKDFNLNEAWNRWQEEPEDVYRGGERDYWLRENVLRPIHNELAERDEIWCHGEDSWFTYSALKRLIQKYGKTNDQIAKEVKEFVLGGSIVIDSSSIPKDFDAEAFRKAWTEQGVFVAPKGTVAAPVQISNTKPTFYAYYADYDWVVFCWLWGRMIDLPKGFPRYCIDLKQTLDEKALSLPHDQLNKLECATCTHDVLSFLRNTGRITLDFRLKLIKEKHPNYPKQTNEHNAIHDARWNKKLHEFINSL